MARAPQILARSLTAIEKKVMISKMKKIKSLAFCVCLCVYGAAGADTSGFQGAFAQIGLGYEVISPKHIESSLTVAGAFVPLSTTVESAKGMTAAFSLGWYQSLNENYLLGVGVDALPFASAKGDTIVSTRTAVVADDHFKREYAYHIFLSPAKVVGKNGLAYAKVGFSIARMPKIRLNYDFTGFMLGLGYKHLLNDDIYAFVEGNYANYGDETSGRTFTRGARTITSSGAHSLESYNILAGVGYSF